MFTKKDSIFLMLMVITSAVFGQVTADFTANKTEGCASTGFQVIFTNTSTGASSYSWDLGNGNTGTNTDAVGTYTNAGVYTVVLTASDGTNTDTQTIDITVHENPVASFTAITDTIGCPGLSVSFQDQSQSLDGNITSWTWNDGSSIVSTAQNPSVVFNSLGSYEMTLFVEDEFGCTDQISILDQVVVIPPPNIGLSGTPLLSCTPPLDVTFSNLSSTGLIYTWDYGVDTIVTSSSADTVVTYNNVGSYDVALTVTDPIGCSVDTFINDYVVIEDVHASFEMSQDTGCPDVLTQFTTSGTTGASSYVWDYGNGAGPVSGSATGSETYSLPGSYVVGLSVTSSSGVCSDDTTLTIVIEDFTVSITSTTTYGCAMPHAVTFTDQSVSNAVDWQWDFGDGLSSTNQNPVHNYSQEGEFVTSLVATSSYGCVESLIFSDTIEVDLPEADFGVIYNPNEVCFPTVVTLTDNSVADNEGTLTQWQWDFGNDSAIVVNTTPQNVTMTYDSAGEFMAILTVTSSPNGCIDTVKLEVEIGTKLNPIDSVSPDTSCAINPVLFEGYTEADSLVDSWEWFGTGGLTGSGQTYEHQYTDTSAIGWNTDTLVVNYNGCYDTSYVDSVFIVGPIVEDIVITPPSICDSQYVRTFSATWIDTTTYVWDFGDGDTIITYGGVGVIPAGTHGGRTTGSYSAPRHVYQSSGDYTVVLKAWNTSAFPFDQDSCLYETTVLVQIRDVEADFAYNVIACASQNVAFNANVSNDATFYTWQFGNGLNGVDIADTTVYPASGFYDVTLTATDVHGCTDDTVKTIQVVDPTAAFDMDTSEVCTGGTINFTDQSVSDTAFMAWDWKFGDGGTSTDQNPMYTFNTKGNYTVELIATDSVGCIAQANMNVVVIEPTAIFIANLFQVCAQEEVQFTDQSLPFNGSTPITGWAWDFGDAQNSSVQNPSHSYVGGGVYDVILTVTDNRGCSHIDTNQAYIEVQDIPEAAFFADNVKVCYDDATPVTFADTTASTDVVSWYWDVNENGTYTTGGTDSTIVFQYTERDTIDISLIVVTSFGCTDTLTKEDYIVAVGPVATFIFTPDTICNGDSVEFTILSAQNVTGFNWDFGDTGSSTDSVATHAYNTAQSQYIIPALNIESVESFGVCEFNQRQDSIYVHHIDIGYTTNPVVGCSPLDVSFFNSSMGNTLAYDWNFDDGQPGSTVANPSNTFEEAGNYNVMLTITETMTDDGIAIGCWDTLSTAVVVYPDPELVISQDVTICLGANTLLEVSANSVVNYQWSNGTTGSSQIVSPELDELYSVTATDGNGCQQVEEVQVTVYSVTDVFLDADSTIVSDTIMTIIGSPLSIYVNDTNGVLLDDQLYDLVWAPSNGIDCSDCNSVLFDGVESVLYTITVTDEGNICPQQTLFINAIVLDVFALDLPDMFSPNDDGANDTVYVKGYGVKELLTFEIYNRWGERVFQNTGDMKQGWDGNFMGKPQNMDTYTAIVIAEDFHGKTHTIKKRIALYR